MSALDTGASSAELAEALHQALDEVEALRAQNAVYERSLDFLLAERRRLVAAMHSSEQLAWVAVTSSQWENLERDLRAQLTASAASDVLSGATVPVAGGVASADPLPAAAASAAAAAASAKKTAAKGKRATSARRGKKKDGASVGASTSADADAAADGDAAAALIHAADVAYSNAHAAKLAGRDDEAAEHEAQRQQMATHIAMAAQQARQAQTLRAYQMQQAAASAGAPPTAWSGPGVP
ncbi:hypothetical protein FNF31_05270 [Cafeteria roenbergensis]|uniref:Uncharacterized protein n=1 Tax=Cafeteria roenbergensis TaxID=33653 RepID=A0A5A8D1U9_CAFRO|nr:hypothetical protein FNF31_05270 [Cafeteria roenbergensis]